MKKKRDSFDYDVAFNLLSNSMYPTYSPSEYGQYNYTSLGITSSNLVEGIIKLEDGLNLPNIAVQAKNPRLPDQSDGLYRILVDFNRPVADILGAIKQRYDSLK